MGRFFQNTIVDVDYWYYHPCIHLHVHRSNNDGDLTLQMEAPTNWQHNLSCIFPGNHKFNLGIPKKIMGSCLENLVVGVYIGPLKP
jgi:hypothetical protein